ncbi:ankyrin repeat domain-containing protein [uncultured Cloacibacillus sp.]|uniref:ankyrin repeat domain-containing protein n=1 Tax=uncultured Cloacibacillus sp. TaxID=889794 RepID=UPI0026DB706E|nr:ankyrin repeat domain-containing protein [uncultured Cloacibacillus sp.]
MREYTPEEIERFSNIYNELQSAIRTSKAAGTKFRKILREGFKNGYPINFVPNENCSTPLLSISLWYGKYGLVTLLLDIGADVNLKDATGRNSLMYAVDKFRIDETAFKRILAKTKDINAKDKQGKSALRILVKQYLLSGVDHLLDCIKLMLKSGAEPGTLDFSKFSALELSYTDNVEKLKILFAETELKNQLCRKEAEIYEYNYEL